MRRQPFHPAYHSFLNQETMTQLAPIGICTYSRLEKLKQTIDALKRNTFAAESELFIFSDGPRPGDEAKVSALRSYLETIDGFKKLIIQAPAENNQFQNTHVAHRDLTEKFGKSIFMEDDNITSPHFLEFMNKGLSVYANDPRVLSVGGYTSMGDFRKSASEDVIFSRMFCPWGVATWARSFHLFYEMNWKAMFEQKVRDPGLVAELSYCGKHLSKRFLRWQERGMMSDQYHLAGDLLFTITMIKNKMVTALPVKSLVKNVGLDETGLHSGLHDVRFDLTVDQNFIPKGFTTDAVPDRKLCAEQYLLNSYSKKQKGAIRAYYLMLREVKVLCSRLLGG